MTQKHYNWMTPDEAAKELEIGDDVWVVADWFYSPNKPVAGFVSCGHFGHNNIRIQLTGESEHYYLTAFIKICRAIVPEVPNVD